VHCTKSSQSPCFGQTLTALQERTSLDTSLVDDIVMGCVTPIGEQGADIAKTAALAVDWDECVPGVQLNRFCASGLEAVNLAAMKVRSGFEDLLLLPAAWNPCRACRWDLTVAPGRRIRRRTCTPVSCPRESAQTL